MDILQRLVAAKGARDSIAIDSREAEITEDEGGPTVAGLGDSVGTVVGDKDLVPRKLECLTEALRGIDVVLDE